MTALPIQYVNTEDGINIAYSVIGEGPTLVLSIPPMGSHLQMDWEMLPVRRYYERLAQYYSLVRFDHRGGGLSGRSDGRYAPSDFAQDIAAVVQALNRERITLWGSGRAASYVVSYVHSHAEQVSHLVLWLPLLSSQTYVTSSKTRAVHSAEEIDPEVGKTARGSLLVGNESPEATQELIDFIGHVRAAADPNVVRATQEFDTRGLLPSITTPTLVMTRREDRYQNEKVSREIASEIAGSRLVVLGGRSALPYLGDVNEVIRTAVAFTTGDTHRASAKTEKDAIRLILFTDVEQSTALTDRVGDEKARAILRVHEKIVRAALIVHGGSEIKTMGDGFMATFSSASTALDAAIEMQQLIALEYLGSSTPIRIRIGIHAGEPIFENDDLYGAAVNRAARIMGQAEGGQILTSDLVRQLVAGKRYRFVDLGTTAIKGFAEPVRLFNVLWQDENIVATD
ncbi:MAG: hypothetical protein OEU36_22555 [Gammaproteobacteria bacterium]|nr:hypothetical protein [Gammaproteobacteria bacterium]